jgi:ferredoxin-NADP reductase
VAGAAVLGRLTWRLAEVVDVVTETPRVKTVAFDVPGWPGHRAGQHVDVRLTAEDGYQAQRSYSIASAPDGTRIALTVERLDDGEVSPYLTDELRPGDQIELRGPVGGYFVWEPSHGGPLLLVAGGSGVAPLMSMIRARNAAGSDAETRLLFSSRSWDDVIYRTSSSGSAAAGSQSSTRSRGRSRPAGRASGAVWTSRCWPRSARARTSDRTSTSAVRRHSWRPPPRRSYTSDMSRSQSRPNASEQREAEMDRLMLDGNAVAGLLQEVFAVEMTTAIGTCDACGAAEAVGALRVFRGAGIVMRCPHCDNVLATIVEADTRMWIGFAGVRTLQVSL